MKNQHFQTYAFAAFLFMKLFSVLFPMFFTVEIFAFWRTQLASFGFFFNDLSWFGLDFGSRNHFRRPSRRHPRKTSKIDTDFYRLLIVLATPLGTRNRLKTTWMHLGSTPIFAPKAVLLRSGPPGRNSRRLWLPKSQFVRVISFISLATLGFLIASGSCPERTKNLPGTRHATNAYSRTPRNKGGRRYSPQGGVD